MCHPLLVVRVRAGGLRCFCIAEVFLSGRGVPVGLRCFCRAEVFLSGRGVSVGPRCLCRAEVSLSGRNYRLSADFV